jgi:hypothetical protein
VECHGVLWLFDTLEAEQVASRHAGCGPLCHRSRVAPSLTSSPDHKPHRPGSRRPRRRWEGGYTRCAERAPSRVANGAASAAGEGTCRGICA